MVVPAGTSEVVAADGQVRLWWDDTPVDLFLDYAPLHAQAARGRRVVPFAGRQISVLGPVELVLFKALFDRRRTGSTSPQSCRQELWRIRSRCGGGWSSSSVQTTRESSGGPP